MIYDSFMASWWYIDKTHYSGFILGKRQKLERNVMNYSSQNNDLWLFLPLFVVITIIYYQKIKEHKFTL